MAATHSPKDEYVETPWEPYIEPTREAYGECSICHGTGGEPEYHERTGRYLGSIQCGNCGGDGKSVLVQKLG